MMKTVAPAEHPYWTVDPATGRAYPVPAGGSAGDVPPAGDDADTDLDPTSGGSEEGSEGTEDSSGDEGDPELKRRSEEAAKYRTRAKQWKQKHDELAQRLEKLENAGKTDEEKAKQQQQEFESLRGENERLRTKLSELAMEAALLRQAKHRFRNPAEALVLVKSLHSDLLEQDDDGEYTSDSIIAAFDKLAKDSPHLLEQKGEEQPKGRSGDPNAGRGKKDGGLDRAKLEAKYPSLRRRVAAH